MFSWFKSIGEKWHLVKTISIPAQRFDAQGKIYFHLYESKRKSRKVVINTTLSLPSYIDITTDAKKTEVYQERILRWVEGRYDPDIPSYSQVPEEETSNALKGKVF